MALNLKLLRLAATVHRDYHSEWRDGEPFQSGISSTLEMNLDQNHAEYTRFTQLIEDVVAARPPSVSSAVLSSAIDTFEVILSSRAAETPESIKANNGYRLGDSHLLPVLQHYPYETTDELVRATLSELWALNNQGCSL